MRWKHPEIRFEEEAPKFEVGQEVPLSCKYCLSGRPILVAIDGDMAVLRFLNGAVLANVPLRDLVDDRGYWKR